MIERTEKEWQQFLVTKSKREKGAYEKRRLCKNCGIPILDINQSGYCMRCKPKIDSLKGKQFLPNENIFAVASKTESRKHIALKNLAGEFLISLGCVEVYQEYYIGIYKVDVVGLKDGKVIAVECGGIYKGKLCGIYSHTHNIYVLPYGDKIPYTWNSEDTCRVCGHRI